ncbi:MAG TPA: F0F1 ATP synthase subunit A [Methylomusa anaerophila]|uniref:ATP synthase subunit a n=1 Tax=Methylomusa anaerophila TaxID=1930071 RepID=A0A348ALB7_9FIRM|nr:F0F1 ATP synthase subunit A [Methylomusa anaerophila]BBB91865.1 ATP synthase subunit a [Methylomusa anaerophila]HML88404.1 F0F1 ATP synthase subunit A [Methylomusa anaerophila]
MNLTPDEVIYWQHGFIKINSTIVTTWGLMLVMAFGAWLITRRLSTGIQITRWQNAMEIVVIFIRGQIQEVGLPKPDKYLNFLVTLFLFTVFAAICTVIPGYESPTASLSTTAALAICVFIAVPLYGIAERGTKGYLKRYIEPTVIMLPFNIITDFSRTLALAVRLFGNMVSDAMIVGIILAVAPLIFPVVIKLLGLLTGLVQAYIFTILAMVYIAAAVSGREG